MWYEIKLSCIIKFCNLLSFCYIERVFKEQLFKTSGFQFDNSTGFLGPKSSRDFQETGPLNHDFCYVVGKIFLALVQTQEFYLT